MNVLRLIERFLLVLGLALVATYAAARLHSVISSRVALQEFQTLQQSGRDGAKKSSFSPDTGEKIDISLWSVQRVAAYKQSLTKYFSPPLAVLRIPKLSLKVPVFEGTDDLTLNRGVGHIQGTANLGEKGNIGIAGHRDGFFRGLKDIAVGDALELTLPDATATYTVDHIEIVKPEDVHVLEYRGLPSLTLVTCFPFYYVGNAPQRYIVSASLTSSSQTNESASKGSSSPGKKTNDKENGK